MNKDRLLNSLEELATKCNETVGEGVTRFSWSKMDMLAHSWLEKEFSRMGIPTWTDGVGNVHALYKGKTDAPRIIIGSHLDTVRNGGKYDGTFGVVAALEVLRSFRDERYVPNRSIEFIAFAEEEGSNFGNTCLGSKIISGSMNPEELKKLTNEETNAWDMLIDFGMEPEKIKDQLINPEEVLAFLEVHIEQGVVLEQKKCSIGVVQAISGMRLHRVTYRGKSQHAASPMEGRVDPVVAFADCYQEIYKATINGLLPEGTSFTCGQIFCHPGINNVVPHECVFGVDLRHFEVPLLEKSWELVEEIVLRVAKKHNVEVEITAVSASGGVKMADMAQAAFREAALKLGYEYIDLNSGPAHDAAHMAHVVPSGLLFVPSRNGISHSPLEYTEPDDLARGTEVFEQAIRMLAE